MLVSHTHDVLLALEQTMSDLKDIETGTRGFVITGDTTFLQPYTHALTKVWQNIDRLKILTSDNIIQQKKLDSLSLLTRNRLAICKIIIDGRKLENVISYNTINDIKTGKQIMDKMRRIVNAMELTENNLMAKRQQAVTNAENKYNHIFLTLVISLFILFGAMLFSFWYSLSFSKASEKGLFKINAKDNPFKNEVEAIVDSISDPFFAIDQKGQFIFINKAAKNKLGFDGYGLTGSSIFEKFSAYKINETGIKMQKVLQSRQPQSFEVYDELYSQWQDVTIYPITQGITVYIKNADERKKNEKELLKTKQFLEETNTVANVGGWDLDVNTGTIYWSPVTRLIHETAIDYTPDLANAINFYKEGKSRDSIVEAVTAAMEAGGGWDLELQIITAKGNEKWIRTKGKTELYNGNCIRLYGTFQDITSQKNASLAAMQLAAIVDYADDAIIRTELDGTILTWNEGAKKMFNYEAEEIIGKPFATLIAEGREGDEFYIQNSIENDIVVSQFETKWVTKYGPLVHVSATVSPIKDDAGNIIAMSSIIRDITDKFKAQEAIDKERKLLKTLIDNIPVNIFIKDLDSKKVLVNNKEMEYMGAKSEDEILGKNDFELYPYESAIISVKEDHEVLNSGTSIKDKETFNLKKDGKGAWFLTSKIALKDEQNIISGILGISYDITERKMAEEKLRLSEEQFKNTFSYSAVGIALLNIKDGGFIDLNKAMESIFGYSKDELLPLNLTSLSHPDDKHMNINSRQMQQLIAGEINVTNLQKRYLHKGGHIIWAEIISATVKDNAGKAVYIISQIRDITNEKVAQQKLQQTLSQLQGVLDAGSQVSIIGTDENGMINIFNKGAENLLGYAAGEMIGQNSPAIIHDKDEVEKRGNELSALFNKEIRGFDVFVEYAKRGEFESREWSYLRKDGSRFPVQLVVTAIVDKDRIAGFLGIGLDISNKKFAEVAIENKNKELKRVNSELEQFAFMASHDLQEPLRTITGFISMLEKKYEAVLDETGKEYLAFITDGALRMKNVIKDILDYSRTGNMAAKESVIDLNLIVKGIADNYATNNDTIKPIITWNKLPEIKAAHTAIFQLFSNLIGNGIKYQPPGNIPVIKINVEDKGDYWQFGISDNGIGIEEKYFDKVFLVFQRLHTKNEYSGTGIGLATCKKIVTYLEGDMWIDSTPGKGTIFYFTIFKLIP